MTPSLYTGLSKSHGWSIRSENVLDEVESFNKSNASNPNVKFYAVLQLCLIE